MRDLVVQAADPDRATGLVSRVGFTVRRGEAFGIVGESGSGKSLTLRTIIGLLPEGTVHTSGTLEHSLDGHGLRAYRPAEVRGRGIAMVFQDLIHRDWFVETITRTVLDRLGGRRTKEPR